MHSQMRQSGVAEDVRPLLPGGGPGIDGSASRRSIRWPPQRGKMSLRRDLWLSRVLGALTSPRQHKIDVTCEHLA
jgi:hypothetical protein